MDTKRGVYVIIICDFETVYYEQSARKYKKEEHLQFIKKGSKDTGVATHCIKEIHIFLFRIYIFYIQQKRIIIICNKV